jgi:hypothetical protein
MRTRSWGQGDGTFSRSPHGTPTPSFNSVVAQRGAAAPLDRVRLLRALSDRLRNNNYRNQTAIPESPATVSPSHPARMGNQPMTTAWKAAREAPLSFLNAIEVAPGFLHVTSSSACPFFRVYAAL